MRLGRPPYGTLAGEAVVVEVIVALRERGHSFESIAETLNRDGIPARAGGPWYPATLRKIVVRVQPDPAEPQEVEPLM